MLDHADPVAELRGIVGLVGGLRAARRPRHPHHAVLAEQPGGDAIERVAGHQIGDGDAPAELLGLDDVARPEPVERLAHPLEEDGRHRQADEWVPRDRPARLVLAGCAEGALAERTVLIDDEPKVGRVEERGEPPREVVGPGRVEERRLEPGRERRGSPRPLQALGAGGQDGARQGLAYGGEDLGEMDGGVGRRRLRRAAVAREGFLR